MDESRKGIAAGGNFIVDHVKIVDSYPAPEMLANIAGETSTNGGGPYNLLTDLSRMRVEAPLEAIGLIGDDPLGDWIARDCESSNIDTRQLRRTGEASTSYTDVMSVASTGQRTFFHQHGANALLAPDHFDFSSIRARVFHLAYLLLLDRLDAVDADGRTGASRVLEAARAAGLTTCADLVSMEHDDTAALVASAAPHLDYLVLNEVEASRIVDRDLRDGDGPIESAIAEAAQRLLDMGVAQEVAIHFAEGAVAANRETGLHTAGSLRLPEGYIAGSVGAGDAFAAGYVWGIHENTDTATRLNWAVCAAAASLSHPTASGGVLPLPDCIELGERFGSRPAPSVTQGIRS